MPQTRHKPAPWTCPPVLSPIPATDRLTLDAVSSLPDRLFATIDVTAPTWVTEHPEALRWIIGTTHDEVPVVAVAIGPIDVASGSAAVWVTVDPDHRRSYYGSEAAARVVSWALSDTGLALWKLHAEVESANVAARHLAKRLGVRREARRRQHRFVPTIGIDDVYGWGVLRTEWDTERDRLFRDERDDVGVGPAPQPWPTDPWLDPTLLRDGDRRNVADHYRYWTHEAIVADLARRANPFHVAIENWRHDNNIGTIVRNANAFGAAGVHIVGRRSWNRRGAMVTDRYLSLHHHATPEALVQYAEDHDLTLIGIDNLPGSVSIFDTPPPRKCLMVFGQEGPGLSEAIRDVVENILFIPQSGSTRSINAGVASGIAMAQWAATHTTTNSS